MQEKSFQLVKHVIGGIPLIDKFISDFSLPAILTEAMGRGRYAEAILLLVKNILVERNALYAVRRWSTEYAPELVYGGKIGDDTIGRALDRLFDVDRASLMTRIVLSAAKTFGVELSQIHNDTTSVTFSGNYDLQNPKALQLKRGHSKDHRPDLKQLIYGLCVSSDGAVPVHFKTYDGNRTDDTTHWETWQTLRGILQRSDFLYVADSKLCTHDNLMRIDREQGRFITVLPRTRAEASDFAEKAHCSLVRWEKIHAKRSSRKQKRIDVFELAQGLYQMQEGFKILWYRSSEKARRDHEDRRARIDLAVSRLKQLSESKRRGPKTEAAYRKASEKILAHYKVSEWIDVHIALEEIEKFRALHRGKPTASTHFKRLTKWVPRLQISENQEAIARSQSMDGVFPLVTNTPLSALDVLLKYKYQPHLEKRHSLLKSTLHVAPVFLKKNHRIEALMFAFFLAQLVASLMERQLRSAMVRANIRQINVLPEERPSKSPTTEQLLRLFQHRSRHLLHSYKGKHVQTFSDPFTEVQKQIIRLLQIPSSVYT